MRKMTEIEMTKEQNDKIEEDRKQRELIVKILEQNNSYYSLFTRQQHSIVNQLKSEEAVFSFLNKKGKKTKKVNEKEEERIKAILDTIVNFNKKIGNEDDYKVTENQLERIKKFYYDKFDILCETKRIDVKSANSRITYVKDTDVYILPSLQVDEKSIEEDRVYVLTYYSKEEDIVRILGYITKKEITEKCEKIIKGQKIGHVMSARVDSYIVKITDVKDTKELLIHLKENKIAA